MQNDYVATSSLILILTLVLPLFILCYIHSTESHPNLRALYFSLRGYYRCEFRSYYGSWTSLIVYRKPKIDQEGISYITWNGEEYFFLSAYKREFSWMGFSTQGQVVYFSLKHSRSIVPRLPEKCSQEQYELARMLDELNLRFLNLMTMIWNANQSTEKPAKGMSQSLETRISSLDHKNILSVLLERILVWFYGKLNPRSDPVNDRKILNLLGCLTWRLSLARDSSIWSYPNSVRELRLGVIDLRDFMRTVDYDLFLIPKIANTLKDCDLLLDKIDQAKDLPPDPLKASQGELLVPSTFHYGLIALKLARLCITLQGVYRSRNLKLGRNHAVEWKEKYLDIILTEGLLADLSAQGIDIELHSK